MKLEIPTAEVFVPLLPPSRYKGAYGGRGSGKSHFFAEKVIDRSLDGGIRTVCIREVQKDLTHSAKKLIEDKLHQFGLESGHGFRILKSHIETPGEGIIIFQGMQDHNAESVKSLEGFNIAWVEEAQTMSERSLEMLRPTIRTPGSELWFSWNPRRKQDPVNAMFRDGEAPSDSICVNANWSDNPWFPDVLEKERVDCKHNEPDQYEHVWEGAYVGIYKGAYYQMQIGQAKRDGRICTLGHDPLARFRVFVDIGGTGARSDAFVMWVAQFVGREIRCLDYYESQGQELGEHVRWLESNGYTPDNTGIWLPHDGATHDKVFAVSYETAFRDVGYTVEVIPNQGRGAASARIEAARRLFPQIWFNEPKTKPGLEALSWYHEKQDEVRGIGLGPDHDWSSHAADAFGLMCVAYTPPTAFIHRPKVITQAGKRKGRR